jgi:hypothetical protein
VLMAYSLSCLATLSLLRLTYSALLVECYCLASNTNVEIKATRIPSAWKNLNRVPSSEC